jgi:hypothetical protein
MMTKFLFSAAIVGCVAFGSVAEAGSNYDGSWDLAFVTQRGACEPAYNFTVNINNGGVTHPTSSSSEDTWHFLALCALR